MNWRPRVHFSAARHWINDPNGLVFHDGEYHLFFQHNPFGNVWGHMSWGHAVSRDLLHWQELPVALPEDERVSIYSGSVVFDERNTSGLSGDAPLVAIYTGCLRRPEGGQAQEIAHSRDRGRTWTKYAHNPVLDLGVRDFRDPKVFWHEGTARWVMAVVLPDARQVVFYASPDLKAWTELSRFGDDLPGQGIWECPDLFELPVDGEGATAWVLKVDAFEGHPSRGSGARLFFGRFDGTRFTADAASPGPRPWSNWADHGADFYAALSWAHLPASPGRALWIGWMNCHRYAGQIPTTPWRGAMSLPRELSLARRSTGSLVLRQQPLRELVSLRRASTAIDSLTLGDDEAPIEMPAGDAVALDIECELDAGRSAECGLVLRSGATGPTRIGLDAERGTVFVDRSQSHLGGGFAPDDPHFATRREAPCIALADGVPVRLRIVIDACSIELFTDDGATVITEQFFPAPGARTLHAVAQGGAARLSSLQVHALAPATIAA